MGEGGQAVARRAEAAERHATESLLRWNAVEDADLLDRLVRSKIGAWTAHCYPTADPTTLLLVADWLVWLTAFDDVAETRDTAELIATTGRLVRVLEEPGTVTGGDGPFAAGLAELSTRTGDVRVVTPRQRTRIEEAVRGALLATLWESGSVVATLADYLVMRRHGSFAHVCLAFVDMARERGPVDSDHHPALQQLTTAAANVFCWSNDLHSSGWEQRNRPSTTLVTVLMRQHGSSAEAATRTARTMLDREIALFHRIRAALPAHPGSSLTAHVDALSAFTTGVLAFYRDTDRYASGSHRSTSST